MAFNLGGPIAYTGLLSSSVIMLPVIRVKPVKNHSGVVFNESTVFRFFFLFVIDQPTAGSNNIAKEVFDGDEIKRRYAFSKVIVDCNTCSSRNMLVDGLLCRVGSLLNAIDLPVI